MSGYVKMSEAESRERAQTVIRNIVVPEDDRDSLVTQIAVETGAEIIEGVLQPGHDLNSVELARRYFTSRTPIREALMLLEKEGLVEIPPRRRPRVAKKDLHTIRQIYRTRGALLEFVARDVAELISEEQLDGLREQIDIMARASAHDDVRTYMWANVEFHDRNLAAANNPIAKRIVESLLLRTIILRRLSLSAPGRMPIALDDHIRLVKAYSDRDQNLAAALIGSNHMGALRNIERRIREIEG